MIKALPFIEQWERIKQLPDEPKPNRDSKRFLPHKWHKALSQKFNPEQLPEMLSCWEISGYGEDELKEDLIGIIGGGFVFHFKRSMSGLWRGNGDGDTKNVEFVRIETINDFLSDLKRSGITATFKPEWITKHGLK